ncbi:outer membrane beta-barrel protein [Pedobacter gandavensis]|uniref:Outer membrane beta-barrel protein n=1 Tax=Pedobacter gandavensis TaxID=2679963 RepID=A0ABR6EZK3_9SPHI|nr:outer membrane beta-barrel protein [Pedobacter gandavensis]MBB2150705.1 outer membrane beta-barrel protein [Pedobacter gandavensis]
MKKIAISIIILAISTFTLQAQTEKGTKLIGGGFRFNTNNTQFGNDYRTYTYELSPKAGYFVGDNFAIGTKLTLGYTKSRQENTTINNSSRLSFGAAPFARHYIRITDRFRFFSEFELNWITEKYKGFQNPEIAVEQYTRVHSYGAELRPGLAFFPTKKWAVEMSFPLLGYFRNVSNPVGSFDQRKTTNDFFNFGLTTSSPRIGINYHF